MAEATPIDPPVSKDCERIVGLMPCHFDGSTINHPFTWILVGILGTVIVYTACQWVLQKK